MAEEIKNLSEESSDTALDHLGGESKTSLEINEKADNGEVIGIRQEPLTPLEEAKIRNYKQEAITAQKRGQLFTFIKWCLGFIVLVAAALATWYATLLDYRLRNIAEPIGGLNANMANTIKNLEDYKTTNKADLERIKNDIEFLNRKLIK